MYVPGTILLPATTYRAVVVAAAEPSTQSLSLLCLNYVDTFLQCVVDKPISR
jgi:hypothetical protein